MILDARTATSDIYRPGTVRCAVFEAIRTLNPGERLVIGGVIDPLGKPVGIRHLQVAVAQVVPAGWKVFTERDGDGLVVYRFS